MFLISPAAPLPASIKLATGVCQIEKAGGVLVTFLSISREPAYYFSPESHLLYS
jgi:hypothetical protein